MPSITLLAPLVMSLVGIEPGILEELKTVAERTDYRATARYDDVIDFGKRLGNASKSIAVMELGKTFEGRSIPLWILADPPITAPDQAVKSQKHVVLLVGNIHGGEVCGKEALPMLAREFLAKPGHPLFKDLIVAMVPIFNADGNERVDKNNRPGQLGPEEGMGIRANAQGFDLNRDFMKLEAPETRALVRFLNEWNPSLVIDTHTTNGSYHRYTLTYEGPKNPAGDHRIIGYARSALFPELTRAFEVQTGFRAFYYGNFNREHTEWTSFPSVPRFGTTYIGLRNRVSILSEAYAYAPFSARVTATRDFVRAALQFTASHHQELATLLDRVRSDAIERGKNAENVDDVPIRATAHAFSEKATVLGYVEEEKNGKKVSTGIPKDYRVSVLQDFRPSVSVRRPYAYLVPRDQTRVLENLRAHGITLQALDVESDLEVESYRVDRLTKSDQPVEGHHLVDLSVTAQRHQRKVSAGTIMVPTAQERGNLAVYLLEPQSDDGLATWNFFDETLEVGKEFPILRLPKTWPLPK